MGKFDTSKIRKAAWRVAEVSHRNKDQMMKTAARGFIRSIILITPPASQDYTGEAAKRHGDMAIQDDVLKLAYAAVATRSRKKALATVADLLAAHTAARSGVRGARVNPRNGQKLLMAVADINRVITLLQKGVGFLAAGWNRAAVYLAVPVPPWIKRHGDGAGECKVIATKTRFRLTVTNAVKYVGDVDGYDRRIKSALAIEAGKLQRLATFLLKKNVKEAGFK